jgi:hypothetical protein
MDNFLVFSEPLWSGEGGRETTIYIPKAALLMPLKLCLD